MTVSMCGECGATTDDGNPTDLRPLPDSYRITDPDHDLRADLTDLISHAINDHPRSKQRIPGPSELGTPCQRRLGYKMLETPEVNTDRDVGWKPTVGTAVHAWLQQACEAYNDAHKIERYYLEQKVAVGEVAGKTIKGQCDVYDRALATVIDWKIVGKDALTRYRLNGPGPQYEEQAHLYGRGFQLLGLPVETVAVVFLPQNGELRDMHVWSQPYDEARAVATLARADGIATLTGSLGTAALPLLPTADAYCNYCPWRMPAATDLTEACPGHTPSPSGVLPLVPTAPAA